MEKDLTEVCSYLNNYFPEKKIVGSFKIEDGTINVPELKDGQYFRIIGSTFNQAVHKYPATDLHDEEFDGAIIAMAVPEAVVAIVRDITEWRNKYENTSSPAMSPYTSESFNNYSYSKSGGTSGAGMTWQDIFGGRLNPYRRLRGLP